MNLADRDGFIWQDGQLVDWRDAKIHVLTHTLHYSMGALKVSVPMKHLKAQQFSVSKTTLNVC